MKKHKELIVFIVFISLFMSVFAYASWQANVALAASKLISTSMGAKKIGAVISLDEVVAATIAREALAGTILTVGSNIVIGGAVVYGAYWLGSTLSDWVQHLQEQPGLINKTGESYYYNGTEWFRWSLYDTKHIESGSTFAESALDFDYGNTGVSVGGHGSHLQQYSAPCDVVRINYQYWASGSWHYATGQGYFISSFVINTYDTSTTHPSEAIVPHGTVNASNVNTYVSNHPEDLTNPSYIHPTVTAGAVVPATNYDPSGVNGAPGPGVQGYVQDVNPQTSTGGEIDPATGQSADPATDPNADPNDEPDPFTPPAQPSPLGVDTSITQPEKSDISTLISGWLANAPFMSIINGFSVEASAGACSFNITLPFGSQVAVMDFCQFSDLWALISVIIIGFAYIYSVMIIFKGG